MTDLGAPSVALPTLSKSDLPLALQGRIVISVDAMGGDHGPDIVVQGLAKAAAKNPEIAFILHGPATELLVLVEKARLTGRVVIR
ncbi:MAG: glycerol-3-phosphate acyltransferase PlsX, partial [Paracoccaceae bacterium]